MHSTFFAYLPVCVLSVYILVHVDLFDAICVGQPMEYYRAQLGAFGLSGDIALRPVASLSGGQKSRVAFTLMTMHKLVVLHSNCVSGYGSLPGDNSNNNDDNR